MATIDRWKKILEIKELFENQIGLLGGVGENVGFDCVKRANIYFFTPGLPQKRLVPDFRERRTTFFRTYARPVEIKDSVWVGGGCILLPGITIVENSVIGAGGKGAVASSEAAAPLPYIIHFLFTQPSYCQAVYLNTPHSAQTRSESHTAP